MSTKSGKKKLRFDTSLNYGKMVHTHWSKGNPLQRVLAPLFLPEGENQITYASRISSKLRIGGKRDLKLAGERAKNSTIESYHKLEKEHTKDKYHDLRKQSEFDFQSLICELIETHGTRNTRWERLYDEEKGEYCMYNVGSGMNLSEKNGRVSICEMCDSEIEALDYKCYNCNTHRSRVNGERYTGKTDLADLVEMDQSAKPNTIGAIDCSDPSASALRMAGGGGGVLEGAEEEDEGGDGIKGKIWRKSRTFRKTLNKNKKIRKSMDIGKKLGRKVRTSFQA